MLQDFNFSQVIHRKSMQLSLNNNMPRCLFIPELITIPNKINIGILVQTIIRNTIYKMSQFYNDGNLSLWIMVSFQ